MKIIKDLKRQVIQNLKAMIAPHVWKSGYGHTENGKWVPTEIFCFAPIAGRETRSMGKVFNQDLTVCQGFYTDGVIDALGGGCALSSFESFCLEDLLAIESWMNKNFQKEVDRSNHFRDK